MFKLRVVRSVSLLASAAVFVTMAPAGATSEVASAVSVPTAQAMAKAVSRPDRVSAMVTARAQKSRVEDLSARTPTTTTYANPDGTWTTEAYAGIVRSKVDDDTWVAVDPSVEKDGASYAPKAAPFDASFSDGGDKTVGSVTTPSDVTIEVGWPTKLPAPHADGDSLTYPDAASDADLVVNSYRDGFDYSLVLDHAPAADAPQVEYRIPLTFGGANPIVQADGSILVKDQKKQVATMTAPVMWDGSNIGPDGERHPVTASVEGNGDSRVLVLKPDMAFLTDPTTTYPVTVDPQVVLDVAGDTWVSSVSPTTSQSTSPELKVGMSGTNKSRSYLQFDYSPITGLPSGTIVTDAHLDLSNFESGACSGATTRMSRITSSWTVAGLIWATQPIATATHSTTSTAAYGATGCSGEGTVTFDATAIANDWLIGQPQLGLQIKSDNETLAASYRRYRSLENGDTAKAPKFSVTYNRPPATPTGLTVSPWNMGYTTTQTPTLSAVVTDPDGGSVRGRFEVRSGTTLVWSGYSPMATSGSVVSTTVPSGVLVDGTTYAIKVYGDDGSLPSALSTFPVNAKVDTVAPTVAITSAQYTNGTWTSGTPVAGSFTFNGPTDTAGFDVTTDGVKLHVGANASGDHVKTWTPPSGWHTIQVEPIDTAGNRGAAATLSFGVGDPGFSVPNILAESPSSFPIEASGPTGAAGAVLSWQVYGESTWHTATQVTSGGTAWSGSVASGGGRSATPPVVWAATAETFGSGTLTGPALLLIKTCFTYPSLPDKCTANRSILLTATARGDNFPEAQVGPASVALTTGDAQISDVDAADSEAGLSRTFSSLDDATLTSGLFGPGWSDPAVLAVPSPDATATLVDNRSKDGSLVIVDPDSGSQTFVLKSGTSTVYVPVDDIGDGTTLIYTPASGSDPDKLELNRPVGSSFLTTTWTLKPSDTGGAAEWTVDGIDAPGSVGDVNIQSAASSQRPVWIRESDPSASSTCTSTTQTVGCRGLKVNYTGTGPSTRITSIDRVIGAATQGSVVAKTLATYTYDTSGELISVCSAAPSGSQPKLCTGYAYTTVSGRTLLSQLTPPVSSLTSPALKPWRFTYDTAGRLTTVKREKPGGGDATWSIDYSLTPCASSPCSSGLPDLTASTVAQWGQLTIPTKAYAVYKPFTGTADVTKAQLYYTTNSGTLTNTASYGPGGWQIDTQWYNDKGREIQHLDAKGWARVQAAPTGTRPEIAAEASSYTLYNAWGDADKDGTRAVDEYGPAHTVTLKDGTTGMRRSHTHTMYDDSPDVDPTLISNRPGTSGLGLVVEETTSTSDVGMTSDVDAVVTKYGYDPIVSGDGNGWVLGLATTESTQVDTSSWSTNTTRYDSSGREIESRQPGGAADGTGAGSDAHSTVTTYYSSTGSGDCGGAPAWNGLICKVGPAGQPAGVSMPTTVVTNYNDDLEPTIVQESSAGTITRTTTTTYDAIGRMTGVTKATTGSGVTNETIATTFGYDDNTGLLTMTTANGETITTGYDDWGRTDSYTDALGTDSAATYDAAGNLATFDDGTATYSYTYDSHNLLSSVDVGGGIGAFNYAYSAAGIDTVTYPNGVVAKRGYDEAGNQRTLTYSQGATQILGFATSASADGSTVSQSSIASSQQFTYDSLGRLSSVVDARSSGCTTRAYGFDASSNRNSFNSFGPGAAGVCQTTTASITKSNSYDSAGRITNTGYAYDTLGRTLTTPQADTGMSAGSALTASYHADNMVASLSQLVTNGSGGSDAKVRTYGLDPAERINTIATTTNGVESDRLRYRYSINSDVPSVVETSADAGSTWTSSRYAVIPAVGMSATKEGSTASIVLLNMHGDSVATMPTTSGSTMVTSYGETDEFGVDDRSGSTRYSWSGGLQRSSDSLAGLVLMGARLYNPITGAFLSPDPIGGGNVTAYTFPQNPINNSDPSGCACDGKEWWRDWASTWVSDIKWGDWKSSSTRGMPTGWILDLAESIYGLLPFRAEVKKTQAHFGHRDMVQRRCVKGPNGKKQWQYRNGVLTISQYRWYVRWYGGWLPLFGHWVPGTKKVIGESYGSPYWAR